MQALLADVRRVASGGHSVVADATFLDGAHREGVAEAAREAGARFIGLWLDAPLPVLEERLRARAGDASDATLEVLRSAYASHRDMPAWAILDAGTGESALAGARETV